MKDYRAIKELCDESSDLLRSVVDEFLLYLIGEREGLDRSFVKKIARYRDIVNAMPKGWILNLTSQYIAFNIFRDDGCAARYLDHAQVRIRSQEELEFLQFQIEHPWRLCFCSAKENPAPDFYEMTDVLRNEDFLLYSPSLTRALEETGNVHLFFYLIGFNGECWQTYGPQAYFRALQPFDLLYFAKQIEPETIFLNEVQKLVDANPIPFMMLWKGGELPLVGHKGDLLVHNSSEFFEDEFIPGNYSARFLIEKKHPLYKLSLKRWHSFPHFALCYYHSKKNRLILTALTDRGYAKLVEALNASGYDVPTNPEHHVTPVMFSLIEDIIGHRPEIDPYERAFTTEPSPEQATELEKTNVFLGALMEAYNHGKEYDIQELAEKAGIPVEVAEQIAKKTFDRIQKNLDRYRD